MKKRSGLLSTAALAVGLALSVVPGVAGASTTFTPTATEDGPVGTPAAPMR